MAYFIKLKIADDEVLVNVDNIDFVRSAGDRCSIFFGGQNVRVDHAAHEVYEKMLEAQPMPASAGGVR